MTFYRLYVTLFNNTLKPKHHHMLHYSDRMAKFGPLKHLWAMRCESIHCCYKQTDLTCKKNILKTLAFHEELRMSKNCQNIELQALIEIKKGDVVFKMTEDCEMEYFLCDSVLDGNIKAQMLINCGYDEHYDAVVAIKTNEFKIIEYTPDLYTFKLYQNINNIQFIY